MQVGGLLEGFEDWPARMEASAKGRRVISTSALPADTTVCASSLFAASTLQESSKLVCGRCLYTAARRLEDQCDNCQQTWFCPAANPDCALRAAHMSLAPHALLCPGLTELASRQFDHQLVAMLRLMLELLYMMSIGACGPFEELEYHPISPEDQTEPFELLRRVVNSCPWGVLVEEALTTNKLEQMLSRIETNMHLQLSGHSLYPSAAMFNHSCNPNCKLEGDHVARLVVTTAGQISAGAELTVSYVELDQPVAARRQALRRQYSFDCNCVRCLDELTRDQNNFDDERADATQRGIHQTLSKRAKLKLLKPVEMRAALKGLGLSSQGSRKELLARLLTCRDKAYEIDIVNATQNTSSTIDEIIVIRCSFRARAGITLHVNTDSR